MSAGDAKWKAPAVKRLLRDFKEVISHPLANVAVHPLEDDLFVWHGNVRGDVDSEFTDVPFHFILIFPTTYPRDPPQIGLYTQLPHPNIVRWRTSNARTNYRLALWDCNPTENQWSSAYTVHSIMVQIQAFLLAGDMMWTSHTSTVHQAVSKAAKLVLQDGSTHTGSNPWPPFATDADILAAAEQAKLRKMVVKKPHNKIVRVQPIWTPPKASPKLPNPSAVALAAAGASSPPAPTQSPTVVAQQADEWQSVKRKRNSSAGHAPLQGFKGSPAQQVTAASVPSASPSGSNAFSLLTLKNVKELAKQEKAKDGPGIVKEPKQSAASVPLAPSTPVGLPPKPPQPSKASKKNKARAEKKRAKKQQGGDAVSEQDVPSSPTSLTTSLAASLAPSPATSTPNAVSEGGWQTIAEKPKKPDKIKEEVANILDTPHAELLSAAKEELKLQEAQNIPETRNVERDPAMSLEMGHFTPVPLDLMTSILMLVSRKDMAALGATCKGMNAICNDGLVWKLLLERDFAHTQVAAAKSCDWKHAYTLQASSILGNLQCFHSKKTHEETVLGLPLYFTVNPRTSVVDYIQVGCDLLSVEAFKQGVLKPAFNDDLGSNDILEVCPVYLDDRHFQEALPHLGKVLKTLNPSIPPRQLNASCWLDTCAKMINTAVLLLIDQGVEASEKACHCYCQAHRLMLALAEHFNLWELAAQRLDAFLKYPAKRNKSTCPNLGWLIALTAVSPKHHWRDVVVPVLLESLDRSVIWACKEHLKLVESFKKPASAGGEDQELLDRVFETTRVSRGLIAFHAAFMRTIARPSNLPLEKVMDQADILHGFASESQIKQIKAVVKRCQEIKSWKDYCDLIGAKPNIGKQTFEAFMTKQLRQAWENSLKKGYHRKDTDFSKIQASGVSKILLKGQSYTCPPNIKFMELKDTWRCESDEGLVNYLDLSLILYHFDGHRIDTVDWMHRSSIGTQGIAAINHTGDIYERDEEFGVGGFVMAQKANVNFELLGPHVKEIYLVASGYSWGTLADVRHPRIVVSDPKTSTTLCTYTLEEHSRELLRSYKALLMSRIHRTSADGSWKVEAIGEKLRQGCTANYGPLYSSIEQRKAIKRD